MAKAKEREKAKARTTTKASAGPNATGMPTTTQPHFHHLPRRLPHHRQNTLVSPRTPALQSQPNTTPPDPTGTAGFTGGFFPIQATSARGYSNLTTRHASTPRLQPVPPPLETRTLNPRINHGGFEETRKTTHSVFHLQFHISNLRCHNRGCYSHNTTTLLHSTALLLPGSHGTTNNDKTRAQPITPTNTIPLQELPAPLPPPPWTPIDIASVRGTAITSTSAAFNNPATSDRATELAARIHSLETELQRARGHYSST
jgi:hypothetical protein